MTQEEMQSLVTRMVRELKGDFSPSVGAAKLKNMADAAVKEMVAGIEVFSLMDLREGAESIEESYQHEKGYRTGYKDGYNAALDGMEELVGTKGKPYQQLANFYDDEVTPWAYDISPDTNEIVEPPTFKKP